MAPASFPTVFSPRRSRPTTLSTMHLFTRSPGIWDRSTENEFILEGYDQAAEDRLLAQSGWPKRARALFNISVLAGSSRDGYFRPVRESNAFSVPRQLFDKLGGYDERFVSPGGGLSNLEIFNRYVTRKKARNICLLSEGTFHQVHGGASTSNAVPREAFRQEYRQIFGHRLKAPKYETLYYGNGEMEFARFIRHQ